MQIENHCDLLSALLIRSCMIDDFEDSICSEYSIDMSLIARVPMMSTWLTPRPQVSYWRIFHRIEMPYR